MIQIESHQTAECPVTRPIEGSIQKNKSLCKLWDERIKKTI